VRLSDVLELAVRHGVERQIQRGARKQAGVVLPLAVGAMIPGIVRGAIERAQSTERALDRSTLPKLAAFPLQFALPFAQALSPTGPLGRAGGAAAGAARSAGGAVGGGIGAGAMGSLGDIGAAPGKGVAGGLSKLVERKLFGREFGEKKDPAHMMGGAALTSFGKEMGSTGANLLRDIANKAMEAAGHAGDASAREAIIGDLKRTDSVLSSADDATLMEAYHTMTRFAPVLSTDKNAVRSFLRQAVMSGSGPDFVSIKLLADSERAVTGGNDRRPA
jgi:hypothetical protein